jgi:hypothetical protein
MEDHKMTNFTFTTREEYLEYRANWRTLYKAQSQAIRDLRGSVKEADYLAAPQLQSRLHYSRIQANRMNVELAGAKKQAAAQRAANLLQAA